MRISTCYVFIAFFAINQFFAGSASVLLAQEQKTISGLRVETTPFMRGTRENPLPVLKIHCAWSGNSAVKGSVLISSGKKSSVSVITVKPGKNLFEVNAPETKIRSDAKAIITVGKVKKEISFELPPYRRFEIFIVQHTHTDIGYTADQPQVMRDHLRFIDEALSCIDATKDYPPDAQFKWVCEVSWGSEMFLDHRPAKAILRLKRAASEGRIELTALCLNMTDAATEEVIIRSLQPVQRFRDEGFEVVSAMQNDVNGFPWALPRLLRDIGVKYFSNGINETRSKVPFDYPSAVWWESPDGSPLLTWRGPHYMMGNFLGLNSNLKTVEKKLGDYFKALSDRNYPYNNFLIPLSGLFTDNSPPTVHVCDLIKEWNKKWAYPHLRTATLKDFFTRFEKEEKGHIPRARKAWCDWWADGVGSGAEELALVKRSQESLKFSDLLFSVTGFGLGIERKRFREELVHAYRTALLFDEHTYGASNSISDPGSLRAKHGWLYKASFSASLSWQSGLIEDTASSGLLWNIPTGDDPVLLVFNPLPWKRTCYLRFKLPRSIVEPMRPFRLLPAGGGKELVYQKVGEETLWIHMVAVVRDIPPCGYRTWLLKRGLPLGGGTGSFSFKKDGLDNGHVSVRIDQKTGAVSMLSIDGKELVAKEGLPYGFGQYVYEEIVKSPGRYLLWPRGKKVSFRRRVLKNITVKPGRKGPVLASLVIHGEIEKGHAVTCKISLWRDSDWAEFDYNILKPATEKPEGVYISFPWRKDLMPLQAEVVGGLMEPGVDQIPKSASDWHSIQNFVLSGKEGNGPMGVWVTHDAPLVQFGGLNMGKYRDLVEIKKPLFYSWPMNNYWFTNFPAQQGGEFIFRYSVGSVMDVTGGYRFSKERIFRPRAALIPRGRDGNLPFDRASFLKGDDCLYGVKPAEDGNGFIIRLRNNLSAEKTAHVLFSDLIHVRSVEAVNILEKPEDQKFSFDNGRLSVTLRPHGASDFRVIE